eukprot:1961488-Pleurochrysis_carterae.AAC.2
MGQGWTSAQAQPSARGARRGGRGRRRPAIVSGGMGTVRGVGVGGGASACRADGVGGRRYATTGDANKGHSPMLRHPPRQWGSIGSTRPIGPKDIEVAGILA